jgi:hypothetical protein
MPWSLDHILKLFKLILDTRDSSLLLSTISKDGALVLPIRIISASRKYPLLALNNILNSKYPQFPYPVEEPASGTRAAATGSDHDLLLGFVEDNPPGAHSQFETLAHLHPCHSTLVKLWDIYVDRVDPFLKIIHLPTFWSSLLAAIKNPKTVAKSLEALICAFYLTVIASLEEEECRDLLGGTTVNIFPRFELAARRALRSAGFLYTTSTATLSAYLLYLVSRHCRYV